VTTANGYRLATSVGGVLTGRGADLIIIDDPLKPDEALSEAQRTAVNEWYENTLYSRLNDKRHGQIILIMQRLHEDDLVGHVLEQEPWEVVSFPAIAEQDEEHRVQTPLGSFVFVRRADEVLHPEREPRATLDRIRNTIGVYNFAGQYQQTPAPLEGGLVKREWFKQYDPNRIVRWDQVVQSWDTANKVTELADFSVCTTWGLNDGAIYLIDVLRQRLAYPDLKRAVQAQAQAYNATVILIEDKASGTQLIQELIKDGLSSIRACSPQHDKIMRLHAQTAKIENGFVYLPNAAPWLAEYLHEITTFPNAKYDDQADSTSQALEWIAMAPGEPGIIGFTRLEAARSLQARGLGASEAAARLRRSEEEISRGLKAIDEGRVRSRLRYDQAYANFSGRLCHECKTPIPPGKHVAQGDISFHNECYPVPF